GQPIAYMRARGFEGRILPVNPNRAEVQGLRAWPSIDALPETPDVAIVAVPGEAAVASVAALAARGTAAAIVFTAGFAETGPAGTLAQARMLAAARAGGMRLLGPNCLGLFVARTGWYPIFTAAFETGFPCPGRIGIASQSGAYGTHLFAAARDRRMGTGACITTGNEADIAVADAIAWLASDPETDVIAAYAEAIRDGAAFAAALARARRARKPVVMMKVGRSAVGRQAAQSHTASLVGDDAVIAAVLAEHGVVRARTTEELLDIVQTATKRIYPVRNALGVITVSGGAGVLISDAAEAAGLPMPPMPEAAQARLRALLPYAAARNPVDCTAQAINDASLIGAFARAVVEDGGFPSVLAFFSHIGGAASIAPVLRAEIAAVRARHPDRLFVLSVLGPPERQAEYEADGLLVFEDPARAVVAIAAMGRLGAAFARDQAVAPPAIARIALPDAPPDEADAKRLLARAGIACVPEQACKDADAAVAAAASLGHPVVMKLLSPDIIHKSEIGGVLLDLRDAAAVRTAFATLMQRAAAAIPDARIAGVLVSRQMAGGVECILGIQRDPVFGPVAMVGLGGVFVEVLRDIALRRCPFDEAEARMMIEGLRGAALLHGARGRPRADVAAAAAMLARLSAFAAAAGPRLRAIDLNPVLVMPEGEGAWAADAVVELDPA
ncbi:MAG TPA: acetate--CoA ligase family protein, partial [Acetobacteraceae bacterium]|nr:acetate--CoA ligase family protein [Acetobacteraceae bacterium]